MATFHTTFPTQLAVVSFLVHVCEVSEQVRVASSTHSYILFFFILCTYVQQGYAFGRVSLCICACI